MSICDKMRQNIISLRLKNMKLYFTDIFNESLVINELTCTKTSYLSIDPFAVHLKTFKFGNVVGSIWSKAKRAHIKIRKGIMCAEHQKWRFDAFHIVLIDLKMILSADQFTDKDHKRI